MSFGSSLCSFKWVYEVYLGISLQLSGRTPWFGKYQGCTTKVLLLVMDLTRFPKVYQTCTAYTFTKPSIKKNGLYTHFPTPNRPQESTSMDYISILPSTKHGNHYVFIVIDRFSKMAILTTHKNSITTEATANIFFKRVCFHFRLI